VELKLEMKKALLFILLVSCQMIAYSQCNVVICNQNVNISLDSDGSARLHAGIIDEGSYDDCNFEIALYDGDNIEELIPFADTITISCDHVGDLILRIRDVTTLNSCWTSTVIEDKQDASISSTKEPVLSGFNVHYNGTTLEVHLPDGIETVVQIYNVSGKKIISQRITSHNTSILLSGLLHTGTYIVSAMINDVVRSKKIVVW